jgi:hypothetical protein
MRVTLLSMLAAIIGPVVGIYASLVGQLTFYAASATGGGASVTVFLIGLAILTFLQED